MSFMSFLILDLGQLINVMYHLITRIFNSIVGHLFLVFFSFPCYPLFFVVEELIITLMAKEHENL
jgi:hypothetical protein